MRSGSGAERKTDAVALMDRIRRGSMEAFRELLNEWQHPLYTFFRRLGIQPADADDCLQELFVRIYTYRDRFEGNNFRAFVFHLARNVSVDHFRHRARVRRAQPLDCDPAYVPSSQRWEDSCDCHWALDQLPERLRVVLVINVLEGFNYQETARILGVPVGTVKSRVHYALQRFKSVLRVQYERT